MVVEAFQNQLAQGITARKHRFLFEENINRPKENQPRLELGVNHRLNLDFKNGAHFLKFPESVMRENLPAIPHRGGTMVAIQRNLVGRETKLPANVAEILFVRIYREEALGRPEISTGQ